MFNSGAVCTVKGPPTDPSACVTYDPVGHTAVYDTKTNSWTAGPDLPHLEGSGDTWSSLLPNGNVLVQTNPPGFTKDPLARANARYASIRNGTMHLVAAEAEAPQTLPCSPSDQWKFYEFDGMKLIPEPAATMCGQPSTLLLPTGEVMLNLNFVYTSSAMFSNGWRPTITKFAFSNNVNPGEVYQIFG